MFDTLIREMADRYGLGDKAKDVVAMVLAYVTDPAKGGLGGMLERFRSAGMGELVQSWVGSTDAPRSPTHDQVESVFGASGGLLATISDKLHLSRDAATSAVGAVLPMLVARLTPGGAIPSTLPSDATALIASGKAMLGGLVSSGAAAASVGTASVSSAAKTATATSGGIGKWLPWIIGALVVIFGISYCGKKTPDTALAPAASTAPEPAPAPMPAAEPPAAAPAAPAADAAPIGAAVINSLVQDVPKLQVFFDSGKVEVAPDFADKAKDMVAYLQSHADVKAVVSGFNDPTGDPVKNAELSKERAMAVQSALVAAGTAADRTVLEKPADATDTGTTNAASRRVDVVLR